MKKFRKLAVCFLLIVAVCSTSALPVSAAAPKTGTVANKVYKKKNRSQQYLYRKDVLTSYTRVNDKHSKYITSTWAKANNYTISSSMSRTVTAEGSTDKTTIKGFGLSYSVESTKGVSTSIPANSSKQSKLALRADYYKIVYTRYWYNSSGKQTQATKYTMYTPIPGTAEYYIKYK